MSQVEYNCPMENMWKLVYRENYNFLAVRTLVLTIKLHFLWYELLTLLDTCMSFFYSIKKNFGCNTIYEKNIVLIISISLLTVKIHHFQVFQKHSQKVGWVLEIEKISNSIIVVFTIIQIVNLKFIYSFTFWTAQLELKL